MAISRTVCMSVSCGTTRLTNPHAYALLSADDPPGEERSHAFVHADEPAAGATRAVLRDQTASPRKIVPKRARSEATRMS